MRIYFNEDKLYDLSVRDVLNFSTYISEDQNRRFEKIAILNTEVRPVGGTQMVYIYITFGDIVGNKYYEFCCYRAMNWSCSNTQVQQLPTTKLMEVKLELSKQA